MKTQRALHQTNPTRETINSRREQAPRRTRNRKRQIPLRRLLVLRVHALNRVSRAASFLVLTLISISLCFAPVFGARESVQVTRLANPVTIDGKWTTADEWDDTYRVSMYVIQGPESTGYIRLKHDADFLYLLVDFISDTTPASKQTQKGGQSDYDHFNVGIDKDVNDTNTECCDTTVDIRWNNGKVAPDPVTPLWVEGAMSYDATNDPDSKTSHAIYEFSIPMGTFEKNSAIRASVWDRSRAVNMHWPRYQGSWSMKYFGDLVSSEIVVPEFPFGPIMILASVVLATAVVARRRTRLN